MFPCAVQVRSAVLVEMDADQAVYFKMIMHELQTSEVCCSSFPNIYKSYRLIGSTWRLFEVHAVQGHNIIQYTIIVHLLANCDSCRLILFSAKL